jgi:hypothetical protein
MVAVDALDEASRASPRRTGFVRFPDSLRLVLPTRMAARVMSDDILSHSAL